MLCVQLVLFVVNYLFRLVVLRFKECGNFLVPSRARAIKLDRRGSVLPDKLAPGTSMNLPLGPVPPCAPPPLSRCSHCHWTVIHSDQRLGTARSRRRVYPTTRELPSAHPQPLFPALHVCFCYHRKHNFHTFNITPRWRTTGPGLERTWQRERTNSTAQAAE